MASNTRKILGMAAATALLTTSLGVGVQAQATEVHPDAREFDYHSGTFQLAPRIIDKVAAGEPLILNINIQGLSVPIYGVEKQIGTDRGCEINADRINITCVLTGPPVMDVNAQLAELETLLNAGQVDCLGIQSPTPDAFVDIINKYMENGVPVFTQNTDVPNSNRIAFYALNERSAGADNGRVTAQIVLDQGLDVMGIALGSGGPEAPWAQDRMGGFVAGYLEVIPGADFRQDEKTGLPVGNPNYTIQEAIDQATPYLRGNQDINLLFHTDQGVEGVGLVIRDQLNQVGEVWTSGFNVSLPILDLIDEGVILTTINQGFDNQAEVAITACVDLFADGIVPDEPLQYSLPIIITRDGGEGLESAVEAREKLLAVLAAGEASE